MMSDSEVLDSGVEVWCGSGNPMIAGYIPLPLSCTPEILYYSYPMAASVLRKIAASTGFSYFGCQ
jgi:hypothetical protein